MVAVVRQRILVVLSIVCLLVHTVICDVSRLSVENLSNLPVDNFSKLSAGSSCLDINKNLLRDVKDAFRSKGVNTNISYLIDEVASHGEPGMHLLVRYAAKYGRNIYSINVLASNFTGWMNSTPGICVDSIIRNGNGVVTRALITFVALSGDSDLMNDLVNTVIRHTGLNEATLTMLITSLAVSAPPDVLINLVQRVVETRNTKECVMNILIAFVMLRNDPDVITALGNSIVKSGNGFAISLLIVYLKSTNQEALLPYLEGTVSRLNLEDAVLCDAHSHWRESQDSSEIRPVERRYSEEEECNNEEGENK